MPIFSTCKYEGLSSICYDTHAANIVTGIGVATFVLLKLMYLLSRASKQPIVRNLMFMSKQCHSSMKFLEELINLKYIFHLKNFLTFLLHAIMKNDEQNLKNMK